jgi:hypothetical protein
VRHPLVLLLWLTLLVPTLSARPAAATDFFVFPVKISITIDMVEGGAPTDRIVKKTLKEKDLVNLALGRPLGTKVDKKTEVLAVALARSEPDTQGKAIVFDPSQNGLAQITTIVALPTVLDRETAYLGSKRQGQGTLTGEVQETTLGNPAMNALHSTTIWGGGGGTSSGAKISMKGVVAGRMSLTMTENGQTTTFAGFIVNGKGKVSGKPIGMFSDGSFVGCGDGIIQANLGEECEFTDDSACPGHCNACTCLVCGNNRADLGEICDGTDNSICDALTPPVPCKPDCKGCAVCEDGVLSPSEECESGHDAACPGRCLFPECQCGCMVGDPNGCPDNLCCFSDHRCWAVKTGFPSDDPNSPLGASICNGGTIPIGFGCADLVSTGSPCPDQDGDSSTSFYCHQCDGKLVHKLCTLGAQSCVLDEIGPLP